MAQRHRAGKLELMEKPKRATAVVATLMAVTLPVPSRRVSRSLWRLEIMVPTEMMAEMTPA